MRTTFEIRDECDGVNVGDRYVQWKNVSSVPVKGVGGVVGYVSHVKNADGSTYDITVIPGINDPTRPIVKTDKGVSIPLLGQIPQGMEDVVKKAYIKAGFPDNFHIWN